MNKTVYYFQPGEKRLSFHECITWGIMIFILPQFIVAFGDQYLTQTQLEGRGVMNAYSLVEHLGMWSDATLIIPTLAYFIVIYEVPYLSAASYVIGFIALALTTIAGVSYKKAAIKYSQIVRPDAYLHDNRFTAAGWIHHGFTATAIYLLLMLYFGPGIFPPIDKNYLGAVSFLLSVHVGVSVIKANDKWTFSSRAKWQSVTQIAIIWLATAGRMQDLW